jgi:hypothetical protein
MAVPYGWPYGKGQRTVETIYLPGDRPVNLPPFNWRGDSDYACRTDQCIHSVGDKGCVKTLWEALGYDPEDPYALD